MHPFLSYKYTYAFSFLLTSTSKQLIPFAHSTKKPTAQVHPFRFLYTSNNKLSSNNFTISPALPASKSTFQVSTLKTQPQMLCPGPVLCYSWSVASKLLFVAGVWQHPCHVMFLHSVVARGTVIVSTAPSKSGCQANQENSHRHNPCRLPVLRRMPFLSQPSQFTRVWDQCRFCWLWPRTFGSPVAWF